MLFRSGALAKQALPLRTVILKPDAQQSRGDFWQALGGKPKASFIYVVTLAFEFSDPVDVGAAATARSWCRTAVGSRARSPCTAASSFASMSRATIRW